MAALVAAAAVVILCHHKNPAEQEHLVDIETKYGTLYYPQKWKEYLTVEITNEERTVCFYARTGEKTAHLFDVFFGEETGGYLGTIQNEDAENVNVSMLVYELNEEEWTQEEKQFLDSMQEDANWLIQNLPETLIQIPQEQAKYSSSLQSDICMETAYCVLKFPGKWKNQVDFQIQEGTPYGVTVYGCVEDQLQYPLFTICFDAEAENPMFWMMTEEGIRAGVTIQTYEIPWSTGWTEDMINNLYAMQEEANYVLEKLMQEYPAEAAPTEGTEEDIRISTPYEDLHFPGKWEEQLWTEVSSEKIYTVTFYWKKSSEEQVPLFAVSFGDENGTLVGTVLAEDGRAIPVTLAMEAHPDTDGWSEEEVNQLYAMKDDVNYLISKLPLT